MFTQEEMLEDIALEIMEGLRDLKGLIVQAAGSQGISAAIESLSKTVTLDDHAKSVIASYCHNGKSDLNVLHDRNPIIRGDTGRLEAGELRGGRLLCG